MEISHILEILKKPKLLSGRGEDELDSRDITGSWTQVSPNRPNFKFVAKIETRLASVGLIYHLVLKFRGVVGRKIKALFSRNGFAE